MANPADPTRIFTLKEVTQSIRRTLEGRYGSLYWIQAELVKLNPYPHSGHCFPELAEKQGDRIVARMRAVIWRDDYLRINDRFLSVLGESLADGINVLICARITYDPVHGIALHITDVDPSYTLGSLEREKRETLARLESEGLLDRNRQLAIALVPARIAVISVETSKGYGDFTRVLEGNPWGYRFFHMLFPAVLQGTKAVETMTRQLERIAKVARHFDVAAIIRGGGDDLGFASYNDYRLARAIALCPIPVMTGIGHAANDTVADRVAAANSITPTKMAEDLVARSRDFDLAVEEARVSVSHHARHLLVTEESAFSQLAQRFRSQAARRLALSRSQLSRASVAAVQQTRFSLRRSAQAHADLAALVRRYTTLQLAGSREKLSRERAELSRQSALAGTRQRVALENLETNVRNLDPVNVMKRGYSITLARGKAVRAAGELAPGELITTRLYAGTVTSTVTGTVTPKEAKTPNDERDTELQRGL
jgi:exodeoxyribonuclease VII large subunit